MPSRGDQLRQQQLLMNIDRLKKEKASRQADVSRASREPDQEGPSRMSRVRSGVARVMGGMRIQNPDNAINQTGRDLFFPPGGKVAGPVPGGTHKLDKSSLIGNIGNRQPKSGRRVQSNRSNAYKKQMSRLRKLL